MMRGWASQRKKGFTDENLFVHVKLIVRWHENGFNQHIIDFFSVEVPRMRNWVI